MQMKFKGSQRKMESVKQLTLCFSKTANLFIWFSAITLPKLKLTLNDQCVL